jgi:hypothetical protein
MKTSPIILGRSVDTDISVDLPHLLETRMLVQSNSGGGKSWALRRLLEQTAPHAQQIIIDVEGEFTTLREKFDFVICAPHEGDAAATPHTAPVLAKKLRELRVSAILDVHDLKAHDRQAFVRKFFEALMQAPRDHWNPALLVLDEAHLFAPEQGKSESTAAVIDVATRGRKRGLALVAATQRLSKLHKDVAAELLNKLIGRTGLDVDVRRAGDELGMTPRDAMASLRDLQPGEFFAFGPALTRSVTKIRIGEVKTTHPKVGDRLTLKTPAPSRKVLTILQELGDLPREAEEEALTLDQLRTENANLKRQLSAQKTSRRGLSEAEVQSRVTKAVSEAAGAFNRTLRTISGIVEEALALHGKETGSPPAVLQKTSSVSSRPAQSAPRGGITAPQRRILDAMARLEALGLADLHKTQVAAVAGVSPTSGSYANNLDRLRTSGLIDYPQPAFIQFTEEGRRQARPVTSSTSLDDLHQAWLAIVTNPQRKILGELIAAYPRAIKKDDLANLIEVSADSGSYANNLGRLRTLGAIDYPKPGYVRAKDVLFPQIGRVA